MSLINHPARLAAIAANEIKFSTGEPCAERGHMSPRYTRDVRCVACDASARSPFAKRASHQRYSKKRGAERIAARVAREAAHWARINAEQAAAKAKRQST
jgi:hypothetical protein